MFEKFLYIFSFFIINLDVLAFVAVLLSPILWWLGKSRWAKRVSFSFSAIFFLTLFVGRFCMVTLETRFPEVKKLPEDVSGIVVLGSGYDFMLSNHYKRPVLGLDGSRVIEVLALLKKYPNLKTVFTGAGNHQYPLGESELTEMLISSLGLNFQNLVYERKARNTFENVKFSIDLLRPKPEEKWVIVASSFHLPRAVGLYRGQGVTVVPYPIDFHTTGQFWDKKSFLQPQSLFAWHYGVVEFVAMFHNYILGRSNTLFPSP